MLKSFHKNSSHNKAYFLRWVFRCLTGITFIMFFCLSVLAKPTLNPSAVLDFDGDGRTDVAVVRYPTSGINAHWYILSSSTNQMIFYQFGFATHEPLVPADYDGDGKWDIAIFRNSTASFYILQSTTNTMLVLRWGSLGDNPYLTQDFDGDRKADPTIVRCENDERLYWYTLLSASNYSPRIVTFGHCRRNVINDWDRKDRAIRGDFDGDGKADIAVYRSYNFWNRQVSSTFHVLRSSDGNTQSMGMTFPGRPDCNVIQADFDGDGKTDFAVVRGQPNSDYYQLWWYWIKSSDGRFDSAQFGIEIPLTDLFDGAVPGDYDGDGKTDLAVARTEFGVTQKYFYINQSRDGLIVIPWGVRDFENTIANILFLR